MYRQPSATRPLSGRPTFPRRILSGRARLHPVVLVPVFLCGALLSPFLVHHVGGPGASVSVLARRRAPEPVYRAEDYQWRSEDVFAPADAPPLDAAADDFDSDSAVRGSRAKLKVAGQERVLAREGHGDGADEWEWWEPPTADPDAQYAASDDGGLGSGADLTSSMYYVRSGLLYFRSSPTTIPVLDLAKPFPVAPAQPLQPLPYPPQPDEGLFRAPPPPRDWFAPGEIFAHPPGKRKHAIPLKKGLEDLHAPLPPLPPRMNPFAAGQAPERRVNPAVANRRKAVRDAEGHVLGPNAAAMALAKKQGRPFVPGKPAEVLEDQRKAQLARDSEKERLRQQKGLREGSGKWFPAQVQRAPVAGGVPARQVAAQLDEEDGDSEPWAAFADDSSDAGGDLDGDEALLEAVRGLDADELALLSTEERALIADLEARRAEAPAPPAQLPVARQVGRKDWRAADQPENARAAQERRLNPPRMPLPKPVFKGAKGMKEDAKRKEEQLMAAAKKGGKVRRKRDVIELSPLEQQEVPTIVEAETSATSTMETRDDPSTASPPSPSANLTRRAISTSADSPLDRLHPIAHLIERAEAEWDDMLRRQSQTLEQAVAEYKRRYRMNPPVGFDSWWRYAMQKHIVLVDEYDQIYDDILPFLALKPSEFRDRAQSLRTDTSLPWHAHSFSLEVKDGAAVFPPGGAPGQGKKEDMLELLTDFVEMLPDLDIRISGGDEPSVVISGEARQKHEKAAKEGKVISIPASFEIAEPTGFSPWDSLCAPNSTARRLAQSLPVDVPAKCSSLRSFVSIDHERTLDICEQAVVRDLNGFTSWPGPRPHLPYPLFSFTKTSVHADLLVPFISNDYFIEIGRDPVWESKKHNKVLWRGDTVGAYHAKGTSWRQTQRPRLVKLANERAGTTSLHLADPKAADSLRLVNAPTKDVSAFYFDVAYSGHPIQCSSKDTTCKILQHEFRFDKGLTNDEENMYKYVLDVDANYASGKFKRLMSSRSLVLKSTIFPEWWTKRIMPWYHYIPIQPDYSDLVDVAAFFIGAPDGTGSHDAIAKRIAAQGKKWSDEHWREVDMAAYLFRLLLEYARLLKRTDNDLHSMDYDP
ncbi:glycosyltransferase family 90 protein [Rhodotorula toruloides]|uniref:Glycosyltransferase family 90 protein n=1 Tax=Rhodotorula toruloides TaxID=5286 RepID=A0A511KH92_RHOTO|nr:glycosyltransferase family 90 protein [Rhodotorula toruloides]